MILPKLYSSNNLMFCRQCPQQQLVCKYNTKYKEITQINQSNYCRTIKAEPLCDENDQQLIDSLQQDWLSTPKNRQSTLTIAERRAEQRRNETPEQRATRLEKNRLRITAKRRNESLTETLERR